MDIARAPQKKTGRNVAIMGGVLLLVMASVLVAGLDRDQVDRGVTDAALGLDMI
jgi:hypothetical protein